MPDNEITYVPAGTFELKTNAEGQPIPIISDHTKPQPVSNINYQPVQPFAFEVTLTGIVYAANATHAHKLVENGGICVALCLHVEDTGVGISDLSVPPSLTPITDLQGKP